VSWIIAAFRASRDAVLASLRRIVAFCQDSWNNGLKRWYLLPVAAGTAIGIAMVSPVILGSMIALMVNDTEAHPCVRLVIDMAAVGVAISIALAAPAAVVALAIVPIADLINRWVDEVRSEKERLDELEGSDAVANSCREGQLPVRPASPAAAR
jgi:hypothetical protein